MPAQANDLLAIDLSSERVRLATWLLDGVRQGQPLGALLGYRFERRLHEAGKAQFIAFSANSRRWWPKSWKQTDQPAEAIAANNVVDGLKLHRLWQDVLKRVPNPVGLKRTAVSILFRALQNHRSWSDVLNARGIFEPELTRLADAVDAVSDALMAETVYQVVRGNPLRAASTVESIAGGETPPPELEVVRTPRTGIALTHRLVTLFSGDPCCRRPDGRTRPVDRANAEPHLNAWAAKLLGNPVNVRCVIERLDPATGHVMEAKELRLNQFRLTPLDFIYAVEGGEAGSRQRSNSGPVHDDADAGRLRARLAAAHQSRPQTRSGEPDELSYGEFSETLRTARQLITNARGIDADDLNPPERSVTSVWTLSSWSNARSLPKHACGARRTTWGYFSHARHGQPGGAAGFALARGEFRRGGRCAAFRRG